MNQTVYMDFSVKTVLTILLWNILYLIILDEANL